MHHSQQLRLTNGLGVDFLPARTLATPLIALIKAVTSTGGLINTVTSPQLTAAFCTVTKVRSPSQVISMRELHHGVFLLLNRNDFGDI